LAGQSPSCPQFCKSIRPSPCAIRRDAAGLAYDADPRRKAARGQRELVAALKIVALAGGDEVPGDRVGQVGRQRPQPGARRGIQLISGDVGRERWKPASTTRILVALTSVVASVSRTRPIPPLAVPG